MMKTWCRGLLPASIAVVLAFFATGSGATPLESGPIVLTSEGPEITDTADITASRIWVFAATIGPNWGAMEAYEHHNFNIDGPSAWAMNVTGEIWLTGYSKTDYLNGEWQELTQPERLADQPWMTYNRLLGMSLQGAYGWNCCWSAGCPTDNPPLPGYDPNYSGTGGCNALLCLDENGQIRWRRIFDGSDFPVDGSGRIHLVDAHGGSTGHMIAKIEGLFPIQDGPGQPDIYTEVHVYFMWHRPAIINYVDAPPGSVRWFSMWHRYGPSPGSRLVVRTPTLIVHHSTADIAWASRGTIDASDIFAFYSQLGKRPCYGLYSESPWDNCGFWYADIDAAGGIDASDLNLFWFEFENSHACELQKPGASDEKARIMTWFGTAYTGSTVGFRGVQMPEVAIVDEAQMRRALEDPYGYLSNGTTGITYDRWGKIKTLYR